MSSLRSLFDDFSACPEGAFLPSLNRVFDAPDLLLDGDEVHPPRRRPVRRASRLAPAPRPGRQGPASPCRGPGLARSPSRARGALPLPALLVLACLLGTACGDEEAKPATASAVLVQLRAGRLPTWPAADDERGPPIVALEAVGPEEEPPLLKLPVPANRGPHELCRELGADAAVDFCEPVALLQPSRTPGDPRFKELWGLARIDAPAAWERTIGERQVTVAVVDDGLALDHPDLKPNLWINPAEQAGNGQDDDGDGYIDDIHGYDFVEDRPDGAASAQGDSPWHGSHVAGTIGAAGDNHIGVTGVAWQVSLMALRALGPLGGRSDDLARAIDYAADHGARVINASWGGGGSSHVLSRAIARAGQRGALLVAAAGNDGASRPNYPASLAEETLLSVGASGPDDLLAPFSARGALLAAPGVGILSTTAPGRYERYDGTSMAAAHVSGLAALLWSAYPSARVAQVRDAILASALPIAGTRYGRVDASRALLSLDAAVNETVAVPGALVPARRTLAFSAAPGVAPRSQTLAVRDRDGAARQVSATASASWISLEQPRQTTPLRLRVRVDPSGLPEGDYAATVTLRSGDLTPASFSVSLHLGKDSDALAVSGAGCAFSAGTLHAAAGSLCALAAPGLASDAPDPSVRWALPGGARARGSPLHARFSRRGRFTLQVNDGGGPRGVPVVIE